MSNVMMAIQSVGMAAHLLALWSVGGPALTIQMFAPHVRLSVVMGSVPLQSSVMMGTPLAAMGAPTHAKSKLGLYAQLSPGCSPRVLLWGFVEMASSKARKHVMTAIRTVGMAAAPFAQWKLALHAHWFLVSHVVFPRVETGSAGQQSSAMTTMCVLETAATIHVVSKLVGCALGLLVPSLSATSSWSVATGCSKQATANSAMTAICSPTTAATAVARSKQDTCAPLMPAGPANVLPCAVTASEQPTRPATTETWRTVTGAAQPATSRRTGRAAAPWA